jgi:hypothetical protein
MGYGSTNDTHSEKTGELTELIEFAVRTIKWLDQKEKKDFAVSHSAAERIRRAKAALLELELAERQREVMSIDEMIRQIEPMLVALRQKILGIPKRIGREFGIEVERRVDEHIRKSLDDAAAIPDKLASLRVSSLGGTAEVVQHSEAAAEADGERVGGQVSDAQPQRRKRKVGNAKR